VSEEHYGNNIGMRLGKYTMANNSADISLPDSGEFRKLSSIKKRKLSIEDLSAYYATQRQYDFQSGKEIKGIKFRKRIYPFFSMVLKIDQKMAKENIVILNDLSINTKKPKVFASTHCGGNDIQRVFQAIKTQAYLMLGDPGILYRDVIYQGLRLNGVIPLDNDNMPDRKIAYQRSVELLRKGGNLLIFPEGAWNATPNLPVMKIFTGAVRMAMEAGAEIVPMAVEQYEKTIFINIGKNYTVPKDSPKTPAELTYELRDSLASLKWEIWEQQPLVKRKDLPPNALQQFQQTILGRCNYESGMNLESLNRERFHDKNITEPEEAFSYRNRLVPCMENAFLMRG